jgi:hypothetical protein
MMACLIHLKERSLSYALSFVLRELGLHGIYQYT